MELFEAKRLREFEDEKRNLERLLVEAQLEKTAMKEIIGKSGDGQAQAARCRAPEGAADQRATVHTTGHTRLDRHVPSAVATT